MDANCLHNLIVSWMVDWMHCPTEKNYLEPSAGKPATLQSFGRDFSEYLEKVEAEGTEVSLMGGLAIISKEIGREVRAQAHAPAPCLPARAAH